MKDKVKALTKYLSGLKDRLEAPVPEKHKDHPKAYYQFLRNEIQTAQSKLESLKT